MPQTPAAAAVSPSTWSMSSALIPPCTKLGGPS